jgi:glycosyltransferase involved in cell wall biosynthesis
MLWDKGVGDIVEAVLQQPSPGGLELILAGRTDPKNPASIPESQLRAWESQGPIHWQGHVEDMNQLYNQVDLVCLPSYREGLPLALLEASLCQKAILTTDVPGCNFLIEHGVNGWVVPARDPKKLAQALVQLREDDSLRNQLATTAREIALKRYTAPAINSQVLQVYENFGRQENHA